jgi:predicted Zn-dependent peptidase
VAQPSRSAPAREVRADLGNGTVLIERADRTSPRVAISLLLRAGAADETAENAGWRRLLADAMLRASRASGAAASGAAASGAAASGAAASGAAASGAAASGAAASGAAASGAAASGAAASGAGEWLSGQQMQRAAEEAGGRLSASVGDDAIEFAVSGSSDQAPQLLRLLLSLVETPRLSDEDIDEARRGLVRRVEEENMDVAARATSELRERLYRDARGEMVAYGLPPQGSLASLNALTGERVRALHAAYSAPSRRVVAIAGDFDPAAIRSALEASRAREGATPIAPSAPYFTVPDTNQPPLAVRQLDTSGAWVFVAYPVGAPGSSDGSVSGGAAISASENAALQVLAAALGESPRARLPKRLLDGRMSLGSANPVADRLVVQWQPRRYRGEFVMFAQTAPSSIDGVKNVLLDEMRRLREGLLSPQELQAAKSFARGSWAVDRETLRERAYRSAQAVVLGLPSAGSAALDSEFAALLSKVRAQDVQAAARKYLGGYAVAVVLPRTRNQGEGRS